MPNSTSKLAKEINDQYFTPVSTAEWCFERLGEIWDLKGTALEPCLGAGSFVKASTNLGLPLEWETNDLFPQPGLEPDTQVDARKLAPATPPDFIFTNPPFGQSNCLARGILKHSLNLCDRVAMVLPKGARRLGFLDAQPDHAHLVLDLNLPCEDFELPDGSRRKVSTCLQAWERKGTPRQKIRDTLDLREELFSFWGAQDEDFSKGGDFQVCRWGVMNKIRDEIKRSGSWITVKVHPQFAVELVKDVVSSVDVSDYLEKGTSVPAFDPPVWLHRVNTEAVNRGLIKPNDI